MAYLGVTPKIGNIRELDDVAAQFNGVAVTFNLRVGGQVIYPGSPLQMLISLGGVLQEANTSYQINNDQITFADPPNPGIDFFGLVIGDTVDVGEPSDGTINAVKLNQGATFVMGGLEVNGACAFDSSTLTIDAINHFVGVGTASPTSRLHVSAGDIQLDGTKGTLYGTGNTQASVTGNTESLVLRCTGANLNGSVQLTPAHTLVNNTLKIFDSGGFTKYDTSANIKFTAAEGTAANSQLTIDDTAVTVGRALSATDTITAVGNIKTSANILIGTNNASDHINITDKTGISAGTLTTTSATETFDSLTAANVRGAKYTVYASHGGHVSTSEVILTHDGTDAFVVMFGDVHSNPGTAVATFSAELTGGNLEIKATATVGTFIQFTRITMNV